MINRIAMFRKYLMLLVLVCFSHFVKAQNLDIHFNGVGFIDNREYKAFLIRSTTIFGTRVALDLGLNLDSLNSFRVGANGLHEFGADPFFVKVDPILYYHYEHERWQFNIGAFPRNDLVSDYPKAMLNDTLTYYQPNLEGMLTKYSSKYGHETIWIDWVSRQTDVNRENFIFGFSGKHHPKPTAPFFISHYFMMLHDAGAKIAIPDDNIRDNGAAQLRLGLDLSHKTRLDSLTFDAGVMFSFERTRGLNEFKIPKGFVANMYLGWKRFGLADSFYAGEGHQLTYGDAFYTKKLYNRIDISWAPFVFNHIHGKFVFSYHQSPGRLSDNQQSFFLNYDLGRKKLVKIKN